MKHQIEPNWLKGTSTTQMFRNKEQAMVLKGENQFMNPDESCTLEGCDEGTSAPPVWMGRLPNSLFTVLLQRSDIWRTEMTHGFLLGGGSQLK